MGRCVETTVILLLAGWGVAVTITWTVAGDTGAGTATSKSLFSVYAAGMDRDVAEKRITVWRLKLSARTNTMNAANAINRWENNCDFLSTCGK
jgi:hypothetical protein